MEEVCFNGLFVELSSTGSIFSSVVMFSVDSEFTNLRVVWGLLCCGLFFEKGSCCFISISDSFIVFSSSFASVVSVETGISFSWICFLIGLFFTGVVFSIVEGDDVKTSLSEVLSEAIFFIASIMSAFFNDSELIIPAAVAITRKSESFLPSKSLISI